MRAVVVRRFGGPEVLQLEEVRDPKPGPGQVLVRVRAIGVNPYETYIRSGAYTALPELPWTPGHDSSGIVEAVGEGVASRSIGERVYTIGTLTGAYAELALCTQLQVVGLPDKTTFAEGAALAVPYSTAWVALFQKARVSPSDVVLVHGASGGVGIATVQLARAVGATVIGTAGTPEGERLVREQGAHQVLDHHSKDHLSQAVATTGGRGIDVIIELAAHANLASDLDALARGGRVIVVGSRGKVEIDPRATMTRDTAIHGLSLNNLSLEERARLQPAITAGLETGALRPIIGRELPLGEAAEAQRLVMSAGARAKIVLVP